MPNRFSLRCFYCGHLYDAADIVHTCNSCGSKAPQGTLDVVYDLDSIKKHLSREDLAFNTNHTMWRFLPFLPVDDVRTIQPLRTGCTPLYNAVRLTDPIGVRNIYIKDEGRNPTGSFKDRASAVGVSLALENGYRRVGCASTGNAASSVACFAASAGLDSVMLVPESASLSKVNQALVFGSKVVQLTGSYAEAVKVCQERCDADGCYNLSSVNPFMVEGQKTIAYELCEQTGFETPDRIFVSVGDGQALYGIYKGFKDFCEIGFIERIPQIVGVQAEAVCPLFHLFTIGRVPEGEGSSAIVHTIADSIAATAPTCADKAVYAVKRSGGTMVRVSDEQILNAMKLMASGAGVFGEPAAAAAMAGAMMMADQGLLDRHERIAVICSGVGLKDITSAGRAGDSAIKAHPGDAVISDLFRRPFAGKV